MCTANEEEFVYFLNLYHLYPCNEKPFLNSIKFFPQISFVFTIQGNYFLISDKRSLAQNAKKAGETKLQNFHGKPEIAIHPKPPQFSILHGAAITGDKEMLQKLLKSSYIDKSAIDVRDKYGRTPLIFSVLGDHPDCLDVLLKVTFAILSILIVRLGYKLKILTIFESI